jgi:RNA polymerase sigma factor (sigma-70 family)
MDKDFDVNPAFTVWRQTGTMEALWDLTERMERFATAICWKHVPDHRDDFDFLVNGIVWRAIQKAETFNGDAKFSTWFYRLTVNECNRYLRQHMERCETSLSEETMAPDAAHDARIDLISLLDGLDGPDHLLFRLVAEGQDFKYIGRTLGISAHAAVLRWAKLKERLRDAAV